MEEYNDYFPTMLFQSESYLDEPISSCSLDGACAQSSKNIMSERNRRKKRKERLFALRAVVPNITKMDNASIIKDAIDYIEELHKQMQLIRAEISELEFGRSKKNTHFELDEDESFFDSKPKRSRTLEQQYGYDSSGSTTTSFNSPLDLLDLRVSSMREKIVVVRLTCSKRRDTMVKVCEVFESLNIKIISATITAFSGRLLKTAFIEADEEERDLLKLRIETAIASLNGQDSPMSS